MNKTKEYLQPNPGNDQKDWMYVKWPSSTRTATRAKLTVSSKIKGSKTHSYPQPEGTLGDAMCKYGKDLGEDSSFGMTFGIWVEVI